MMTGLRLILGLILVLAIGAPLMLPLVDIWHEPGAWEAWGEWQRLGQLAKNTGLLVAGTLALTLPAGMVGALLCYRTDLPGRGLLRLLLIITLFVPLPLFASAWQAALGSGGCLPIGVWSTPTQNDPDVVAVGLTWKPWAQGLPAAIWIHSVAALPWVVMIAGQGLRWVETELEEDGLTAAGTVRVLWLVTLPRCRLAIGAAALWVAIQAGAEITITDMFQVRTFAEEVYYQYVVGDSAAVARGIAVAAPLTMLIAVPVLWMMARLERQWSALQTTSPRPWELGPMRWPCFAMAFCVTGLLIGVPLGGLVWKLGLGGNPQTWRFHEAAQALKHVFAVSSGMIGASLIWAAVAGALAGLLALVSSWLAVDSRHFRFGLIVAMTLAWAWPAPVIGLGLKAAIEGAMNAEDSIAQAIGIGEAHPMQTLLYDGPSQAPIVWASVVRYFPFAVAFFWPFFRRLPDEWRELAQLEGARPLQEFRYVIWPVFLPVTLQATLAVAILSLGEVSAGKLAETPGTKTFAHELFNQMHYGVTNNLAALALVLLALVAIGAAGVAASVQVVQRFHSRADAL